MLCLQLQHILPVLWTTIYWLRILTYSILSIYLYIYIFLQVQFPSNPKVFGMELALLIAISGFKEIQCAHTHIVTLVDHRTSTGPHRWDRLLRNSDNWKHRYHSFHTDISTKKLPWAPPKNSTTCQCLFVYFRFFFEQESLCSSESIECIHFLGLLDT